MSNSKIGRTGETLVQDVKDGVKVSFSQTPAGPRVNVHEGAKTRPADPADYGIRDIAVSVVGGGNLRVTVKTTDGQAIDSTQRQDGTLDEQIHTAGITRKK